MVNIFIHLWIGFIFFNSGSCSNVTFGVKVREETSPKYVIRFLTPSPSPSNSDVHWLDTLSPAEKIAVILAITILLVIILTGICYNGRVLCKRSPSSKKDGEVPSAQSTATTQQNITHNGLEIRNVESAAGTAVTQSQGNPAVPQVVIYNVPHLSTADSSHEGCLSIDGQLSHDRHVSGVFPSCQSPRSVSGLAVPQPYFTPTNKSRLGSLYSSAPDLSIRSEDNTPRSYISQSRSAQYLSPPAYTPLAPSAPPGDGIDFFDAQRS
ncbi:hypothetical protein AC249_AIPGENE18850 [Exaiptasia diaphana]|nr:hypothetical protein AC249_AIPGENE18850 [Exaiptasia diaphana]